jgi:hypothetical protein
VANVKHTDPSSVLSLWHLLELLAYTKLEKQLQQPAKRLFARIPEPLVWRDIIEDLQRQSQLPADSKPLALVYMGVFKVAPLLAAAYLTLDISRSLSDNIDGETALAAFRLTRDGHYADNSLTLSALPWTVGLLERRPDRERLDAEGFSALMSRAQEMSEQWIFDQALHKRPIEHADLVAFSAFLRESAGCASVMPEELARILVRPSSAADEYEEDELLKSPFLTDIESAQREQRAGDMSPLLAAFLGDVDESSRRNHAQNRYEVSDTLRPENWARGAWPNEAYDPILMQEVAISVARLASEGKPGDDRFVAVNGPPGTGKTTLLRAFIADRLVERARILVKYEEPRSAFTLVDEATLGNYNSRVYAPADDICGYEMVIATMNNPAAEKISDELPAKDSVHGFLADLEELDHYAATSAAISESSADQASWGLIAASLGSTKKRNAFRDAFWWDERGALDAVVTREVNSKRTFDWNLVREQFRKTMETLERRIDARQHIAAAISLNRVHAENLENVLREHSQACARLAFAEQNIEESSPERSHAVEAYDVVRARFVERFPPFVRNALATFLHWLPVRDVRAFRANAVAACDRLRVLETDRDAARKAIDRLQTAMRQMQNELESRWRAIFETAKNDEIMLDPTWWRRSHAEIQEEVPLFDKEICELRRRLFVDALRVHRAFVQAAWIRLKPTLHAWSHALVERSPYDNPTTIAAMWRAAFLVVPAISTTFASVSRIFRDVPNETFAWAIVDEAGQAVPQAAVGLFRRTRRALVVGDPNQILPVVPIGERLVHDLRRRCGVHVNWVADGRDGASLQTLADNASRHGATRGSDEDSTWIGIPLYVHRRCVDPMFTISNNIAYGGVMINRTPSVPDTLALPSSRWIDMEGRCDEGHVVMRQIDFVGESIRQIRNRILPTPSVYVITPFLDIARTAHMEFMKMGIAQVDIGTVHTIEGKQADIVFMILGLDGNNAKATDFAAQRPNLLNVAVTRAKHRCYIVGSARIWGTDRYFGFAHQMLGESKPEEFETELGSMSPSREESTHVPFLSYS